MGAAALKIPDVGGPISELHAMLETVERHYTAERINQIANHPAIVDWVRGPVVGPLDISVAVADRDNVCLVGEFGAILFHLIQPGIYEVHSMALPEGRGPWMLGFAHACLHWIFTRTPAVELMTRVPQGNLGARTLCRLTGWEPEFMARNGWIRNHEYIPASIFSLTIQKWMRTAPGLVERGEWFHDRLESEFNRLSKTEPPHPEDGVHNRAVGVCAEMIFGGQPEKGVVFYHRWATFAGYAPISIVTRSPLSIDITSALLIINEKAGDFWVANVR